MKHTKATKRRVAFANAFNTGAAEIAVQKFAARRVDDIVEGEPVFSMTTRYGEMRIWPATDAESVLDGIHRGGSFFTAFCRFETHDRAMLRTAADRLGSNPFSGKYNFHLFMASRDNTRGGLDAALAAFEQHLQAVAPEPAP